MIRDPRRVCYHAHSHFSDGRDSPAEMIVAAEKAGYSAFSLTCHAPVPWDVSWCMKAGRLDSYLAEIAGTKALFTQRGTPLEVLASMEIDYFHGGPAAEVGGGFERFPLPSRDLLDFRLGAVHCLWDETRQTYGEVDAYPELFTTLVNEAFRGDLRALLAAYFASVKNMVERHQPELVAHLDLPAKQNTGGSLWNENDPWYLDMAFDALAAIRHHNCAIEVNTGGVTRGRCDKPYPGLPILKEARRLGIPVTYGADAHAVEHIDANFELALNTMKLAGYDAISRWQKGTWVEVEL